MAERSLRGMSIGAKSLESDDNVDFAARTDVAYVCPKGHRTILPFAEGAEFPDGPATAICCNTSARRLHPRTKSPPVKSVPYSTRDRLSP